MDHGQSTFGFPATPMAGVPPAPRSPSVTTMPDQPPVLTVEGA